MRDYADGWLLDLRDAGAVLSGSVHEGTAFTAAGEGPSRQSGWGMWAGTGQGKLYSMEELPLVWVGLGLARRNSTLPWSISGTWSRLGKNLMREDTGTLGLRMGGKVRVGMGIRARRWNVAGIRVSSSIEPHLEVGLELGISRELRMEAGVWIHPVAPPSWHGSGSRRSLAEVKFYLPAAALAIRIDQRADGVPVISQEILGRLTRGLGLSLRADPETGTLGGGLTLRVDGFWLRTSHLVHPALGATHRFGLGAGAPEASPW